LAGPFSTQPDLSIGTRGTATSISTRFGTSPIYGSDDLIIGTFAHEIHELELLEAKFYESGGTLEATNVRNSIDNDLHPTAWTHADEIVSTLQKSGELAWP
jgi:hypothetical protein